MDAVKRAQLEKYGVAGLGVVFLIVFLTGPAKSLDLFKSSPSPATESVPMSQPLSILMERSRQRGEVSVEAAIPAPAVPGLIGTPLFTAHAGLRSPFKNQLPVPEPEVAVEPALTGGDPEVVVSAPIDPPAIAVQGVVWGSARPKAIIDHHVYGLGDAPAEGASIIAIDAAGLIVEFEGAFWRYAAGSSIPEALDASAVESVAQRR